MRGKMNGFVLMRCDRLRQRALRKDALRAVLLSVLALLGAACARDEPTPPGPETPVAPQVTASPADMVEETDTPVVAATSTASVLENPTPLATETLASVTEEVIATATRPIPVIPPLPNGLREMEEVAAEIPGIVLPQEPLPLRGNSALAAREEEAVRRFLSHASLAETVWGWTLDTAYVQPFFTGALLEVFEQGSATLRAEDVRRAAALDRENSYYVDIRVVGTDGYEIDSCEWWDVQGYRISDGAHLGQLDNSPRLIPQTIRVQYIGDRWYVTSVTGYDAPHFCE